MTKENISQEFELKSVVETRNYFIKEIVKNELMSNKHKMACTTLNYMEHFLSIAFAVTGCIPISGFASLLGISGGISRIKNFCNDCRNWKV